MFAERLCHPFCHEEVEGGDCLSAVLLVLVGLEDDGGKRSITLDALRRADAAVLGAEATFKEIVHVILDAGGRLCRIVIEVVNMDIAQLVRFGKTFRQQIFIGVVFGDFRCKCHHLSGRRVAAHVGVAQVHVVLVDGDYAVHYVLHLGFLVPFRVPPFAVDDVLLGHFGAYLHQCLFY